MLISKRIGLLGGSFNPAHEGHLHITREALKRLGLDEVWWMVSPGNPLKSAHDMLPFARRLASAREMADAHPRIHVTDIEQSLGTRYTFDTILALKRKFPGAQFVWLMGADNLATFHRWQRWRELMHLVPVAVLDRAPFSHRALRSKAAQAFAPHRVATGIISRLAALKAPAWAYVLMRRHPASSTALRRGKQ